jgi:hypothetical protein
MEFFDLHFIFFEITASFITGPSVDLKSSARN